MTDKIDPYDLRMKRPRVNTNSAAGPSAWISAFAGMMQDVGFSCLYRRLSAFIGG
jgi:hypothetical protein